MLSLRRRSTAYNRKHKELEKKLTKEERRLTRTIEKLNSDVVQADRAGEYRHHADLLMSHPDPQLTGEDLVTLTDWEGGEVEIKLDAKKTIIENAKRLYDKARNSERAAEERQKRLPALELELSQIKQQLEQLAAADSIEDLEAMDPKKTQSEERQEPESPYRVFVLGRHLHAVRWQERCQQRPTHHALCKAERLVVPRSRFIRLTLRLERGRWKEEAAKADPRSGRCYRRILLRFTQRIVHTCCLHATQVRA